MATLATTIALLVVLAGCSANETTTTTTEPVPLRFPGDSVDDVVVVGEKASSSISVAAAANIRDALERLQPALEDACESDITFVFGSSGRLRMQVLAGARFGLFLSADIAFTEEVFQKGFVVPDGAGAYGIGRLALIWRNGVDPPAALGSLSDASFGTIAIANPSHAPYGRAASEALSKVGVLDAVEDRLVLGDNARQAVDYAETGNADAALVALALVVNTGRPFQVIESTLHEPILQTGAVIKGTGAELTGRCILQYLLDPEGQTFLSDFGFEVARR
ncbi:MAG TPA: molybdate ABC transporter substrate-binding protein [Dehalococcoidia bacterium]|nr:molybdate ABC transporter substrate-binding protein [Dehalococcoidia bacterium]